MRSVVFTGNLSELVIELANCCPISSVLVINANAVNDFPRPM